LLEKASILPEDSDDDSTPGYLSNDALYDLARRVMDRKNMYWENEIGNTAYLDMDRLAQCTTLDDVQAIRDGMSC
jgi:hypothetical protein